MGNSKNKTENSGTLLHATKQIEENWWSDNNDINVIFAYIYIQNFGVDFFNVSVSYAQRGCIW